MRILIYAKPQFDHQKRAARLFAEGFRRHGLTCEIRCASAYEPSDLAVIWGPKHPRIIREQSARGLDYLMMERGFVGDRLWWISAGFNGLNGCADFQNADVSGDRWSRLHSSLLEPWRKNGVGALLLGNAPVDDADIAAWTVRTAQELLRRGHRVRLRLHPDGEKIRCPAEVVLSRSSNDLYTDLEGVEFAVAHSTTAVVQVALAGVPLVCMDKGALAWEIAAHALDEPIVRPDRTRWAHRLAYCQWTPAEVASGEAWAHLRRKYAART